MHNCRQAIILAAGSGRRLNSSIPLEKPKSLFVFNKITLLERNINLLLGLGIQEIIIVGGYKIDMIKSITDNYNNVTLINNSLYEETDTMYSLGLAEELIKECFIQTEGDFVSEPAGFIKLLNNHNNAIICSQKRKNNGVAIPIFENGEFKKFSRLEDDIKLNSSISYIGPSHFTKDTLIAMKKYNNINNNKLLYEEALSLAITKDKFDISLNYINNFDYWDLNKEEDFDNIQQLVNRLDGANS